MNDQDITGRTKSDIKKTIDSFFSSIVSGNYKDVLPLFAKDCKTHNPYVAGGISALIDAMIAASKEMGSQVSDPEFDIDNTLVDGNLAAVHTHLIYSRNNPGKGGLRQVHIFRFEREKIVEYWDITQQISESMPKAASAF